jgi:hypothetical protein
LADDKIVIKPTEVQCYTGSKASHNDRSAGVFYVLYLNGLLLHAQSVFNSEISCELTKLNVLVHPIIIGRGEIYLGFTATGSKNWQKIRPNMSIELYKLIIGGRSRSAAII